MEKHEIETFLVLAEELHFGRTAKRRLVSTARVSQTVKTLERRLGAPLFDRNSHRVRLTALGEQFERDLRPAYEQLTSALERAVRAGRGVSGRLRAGFVGPAAGRLLMLVSAEFTAKYPECEVETKEAQVGEVLERLHAGDFDLVAACLPIGDEVGLAFGPVLLSEQRMLAVPAGHPLARAESVSVAEQAALPNVLAPCSPPLSETARQGLVAETFQQALTLVGAGVGALSVGAHAAEFYPWPDVAYVPFSDAPPLEWALVWRAAEAGAQVHEFAAVAARR